MPNLNVIGVAGQRQNGKDTLADHLALRLGWRRGSFAAAVKRIYCETFQKDLEFVEKWKEVPTPPPGMDMPVRQALQFIGDGFRQIQGNIWIEMAFRDPVNSKYSIFSDLRYINEAKKIKQQDGFNFLIYRPGKLNSDKNLSEAEIRPYIQWCEATGREGFIKEWPEYQAAVQDQAHDLWYADDHATIQNLSYFDYFVRNDANVDALLYKADAVIVPELRERYVKDYDR